MSSKIRTGLLLLTIAAVWAPAFGAGPGRAKDASVSSALPQAGGPACVKCGEERWDVKTLSDPAANQVNFDPKPATVKQLYSMKAPTTGEARHASEQQTYVVQAKLVGYKIEFDAEKNTGDHDFHIVIQDLHGTQTMVVEIPDSQCAGACTSLKKDAIESARTAFQNGVTKPPEAEFFALHDPVMVEVTGVLFFDFAHRQTGLAKNCAELHPVTAFKFASQPSGVGDKTKEPKPKPESFYRCLPKGP